MALATGWMRELTPKRVYFELQYHADQNLDELREFWGEKLDIDSAAIHMKRKSNSNQLTGRTWRSVHGVVAARANDTAFRARVQAWMDLMCEEWSLDSASHCLGV
jgi:hypothetical protein